MRGLIKFVGERPTRKLRFLVIFAGIITLCSSCDFLTTEIDTSVIYHDEYDLSLTQYIETNSDQFSILYDILDTTGLGHLFKAYGDYTFLAPTDSAFNIYFQEKGKSSYKDFEVSELAELIKYHIFEMRIMSGSFNMGIVDSKTLTFDYMVSSLSEDGSDVYFNKTSKILTRDVDLPNGILHSVDRVIENPKFSMLDWLTDQGNYTIFIEALEKTGWDKLAGTIGSTEGGGKIFYSAFVTPDDIYAESNINSFSDLAAFVSPDNNNYTDSTNSLYALIGSQFIDNIMSISDASEEHAYYGTVGLATLKFGLIPNTAEVSLNYDTPDFPNGLGIDEFNSNNLTANGIIHVMDTMYQITKTFERIRRRFIFLDVPGIPYDSVYDFGVTLWEEQGIIAKETNGGNNGATGSENWLLGQWAQYWPRAGEANHLPFERTNGWLTLNSPYAGAIKGDHHRNNELDWETDLQKPVFFYFEKCDDLLDVTRKLPYIIPGKYRLIHFVKCGTQRPSVKHYFDGEPIGGIINLQTAGLEFQGLELGIVNIKEDETEHYFRIQALTVGTGFYIYIILEPVD